jgi:wyosine [tRNA(Phe)-imidazoG37] synthetase (radical SAM superfamily)
MPLQTENDTAKPVVSTDEKAISTVYGPVTSWRFGQSLGIDLIRDISTCSFNCIYCQLGDIQDKTMARRFFVSTAQVLADLEQSAWQSSDIITLSGSGEPTLALNCGEVIEAIKGLTGKPVMVLTNGTLLHLPEVRKELAQADQVAVKLDAADEAGLKQVNRPVAGVTLENIVAGIAAFRKEYHGKLSVQMMFMPANLKEAEALAVLLCQIQPDEVQLNTPKRPYPLGWFVETRGNHTGVADYPTVPLRTVSPDEADVIEALLAERTGVPILSIYRKHEG